MHVPTPPTHEPGDTLDFFLVSAHELRTSLSAMKWMFKMLLDGDFGPLNETQSTMIAEATRANERMIVLINDTMTAVRNENSSITYDIQPIVFDTLTEETIKDFTNEAANKGMHIRYTAPLSPLAILGDSDKIRIVLHNLIENAIKYGDTDTDISISLKDVEGIAYLTIADTGLVIPDEEQPHIFQKFFRSSNTANVGLGLGLYATRQIILRHDGTISFVSSTETGTVFTVTLPTITHPLIVSK